MAAPTLLDFRATFPEFGQLKDEHVQKHLDLVVPLVDEGHWLHLYVLAVLYQTADQIAQSPWGYNARLSTPGSPTAYFMRLQELRNRLPHRVLVVANDI